jgi:hypothetical protein
MPDFNTHHWKSDNITFSNLAGSIQGENCRLFRRQYRLPLCGNMHFIAQIDGIIG